MTDKVTRHEIGNTIRFTVPSVDHKGRKFHKLVAYSYGPTDTKPGGFWCHKNFSL